MNQDADNGDPDRRRYRGHRSGSDRNLAEEIRATLADGKTPEAIGPRTRLLNELRDAVQDQLPDFQNWRNEARSIKEDAIDRLPELMDRVQSFVESSGGSVYVAEDAEDANEYIQSVCDEQNIETAVKSKSMTTEEIELNQFLEASDVRVVETDLGEFVAQLAGERPSHIIAPILHKSTESIAEVFRRKLGLDPGPDPSPGTLTEMARDHLRTIYHEADLGITGANFVLAESGTVALVTNEGNARWSIESTDTFVAVAGVEKLIPSVRDLHPFFELLPRSGTGQAATSYFTMISPDRPDDRFNLIQGTERGERDFHLVLLDNGRLEMAKDPVLREALYCIRCGACLNACANYQSVGGHVYGGETYAGGIGNAWEAGVTGREEAESFNDLCTGCSQCKPACPVKIDIPWMNTVIRDRLNRELDREDVEGFVFPELLPDEEEEPTARRRFFGSIEQRLPTLSRFAPLVNTIAKLPFIPLLLRWLYGFSTERSLPTVTGTPFTHHGSETTPEEETEAVLLADPYTNYLHPERLEATAKLLDETDVTYTVRYSGATGRAALSQGMIEPAQSSARDLFERFETDLEQGRTLVVVEPSVATVLTEEYEHLLESDEHKKLADHVREIGEYLNKLHQQDKLNLPETGDTVFVHGHCQQRAADQFDATLDLLDAMDCEVEVSQVECCGMAGSFGYKEEFYELSMAVGQPLFEAIEETKEAVLLAPGTSCTTHITGGTERTPAHPTEYIASNLPSTIPE
jgi:iron-sulfur cluster protein